MKGARWRNRDCSWCGHPLARVSELSSVNLRCDRALRKSGWHGTRFRGLSSNMLHSYADITAVCCIFVADIPAVPPLFTPLFLPLLFAGKRHDSNGLKARFQFFPRRGSVNDAPLRVEVPPEKAAAKSGQCPNFGPQRSSAGFPPARIDVAASNCVHDRRTEITNDESPGSPDKKRDQEKSEPKRNATPYTWHRPEAAKRQNRKEQDDSGTQHS